MSTAESEFKPTSRQNARRERTRLLLEEHSVPMYWHGPLLVEDDNVVVLQTPTEVAKRTVILWAVELRAEGVDQQECHEIINGPGLWDNVSAKERGFLASPAPDADTCRDLVWRLESIWVMLWALGYIDLLAWPSQMCAGADVAEILATREDDPEFITQARLRPVSEILDAQELTLNIHWAIRETRLHGTGMIPAHLDWRDTSDLIPIELSHAANVVLERHWSLNWLAKAFNPKTWDDVELHT